MSQSEHTEQNQHHKIINISHSNVNPREAGTSSDSIFMEMKTTTQLSKQNE